MSLPPSSANVFTHLLHHFCFVYYLFSFIPFLSCFGASSFIKSATPNPPTIVVSPTKTVDARAIEVQDNQQVDQEAREKVCDAYVSKMCDVYVMLCLYMLWNFLVRCFPFKVLNFHNLFILFNNLFCKLISCMARNEHTTLIMICVI